MGEQAIRILLGLVFLFALGYFFIEYRERAEKKVYGGAERRKTRKITELEPLGETILRETEEMLDRDRLQTRDGLKFIMKMMGELYVADMRRTLKMNEVVEQLEVMRHKSLIAWIEDHKKTALFLLLIFFALVLPEIRLPILRYAFGLIGVQLP